MPSIVTLLQRLRVSRLGRRERPASSAWQVIGWWEARRIPFNLIVGVAGVASGTALLGMGLVSELLFDVPMGIPDPPILAIAAIVFYAVAANVCFTGGWMAELVVRRTWPHEAEGVATLSFTLGLVFAVAVTLLPPVIVGALGILGAIAGMLGDL